MIILPRIAAALTLMLAGAGANAAQSANTPASAAIPEFQTATSIPPNCTMDPWTHKYVCHKWPKKKRLSVG